MREDKAEHALSYRRNVLENIFDMIRNGQPCYLISGRNMGKVRLLDFMMRREVQKHYLHSEVTSTFLVRVDLNRLFELSAWGLYELMFSSLMLFFTQVKELSMLQEEYMSVYREMLLNHHDDHALDALKMAVKRLCQEHKVCFIFDEFDPVYRGVSANALTALRTLRDENQYHLCYVLILRELPEQLRLQKDSQHFDAMFSRSLVILGPYSHDDSMQILQQLEARRQHPLKPDEREWIFYNSGGHPGLMLTLFTVLVEDVMEEHLRQNTVLVANQNIVHEECRKIWDALSKEEQDGLMEYVKDHSITSPITYKLLLGKGFLGHPDGTNEKISSPIFRVYMSNLLHSEADVHSSQRPLRVFLCYSTEDQSITRKLYASLCSVRGIDPWLNEYKLLPGTDWDLEIRKALRKTDVVIICLSPKAIRKEGYVQKEIALALGIAEEKPMGTIFIVPLKLEDCEVPEYLSRWHWVNYFEEHGFRKLLLSLEKRARGLEIKIDCGSLLQNG